ncbi:MAG: hypothetical protein A3F72_12950, partial [Bacteroidetes bacterium RIFCSPLOWO2_12_FULL_35_15]
VVLLIYICGNEQVSASKSALLLASFVSSNCMRTILTIIFLIFTLTFSKVGLSKSNDSLILDLTHQVMMTIKNKDFKKLADYIHPTLGVRFSPYAYIDPTNDIKFTPEKFLENINVPNKLNWGSYDPSGDKIFLTINDYFLQFVYSADFLNAEKRSVNKMIGGGNSLNNLKTIYNDCDFSESYFSGFDKKLGGMDWCSLRLVFKKYNEKYYLVGIVHDQWTI